jgi:hypothetical protein
MAKQTPESVGLVDRHEGVAATDPVVTLMLDRIIAATPTAD